MSTVASVDYVAKRIYLSAATVGVPLDTMEVYRDVRELRRITEAHRTFKPMIIAGGNIQKTTTSFTQPYVVLLYGSYIVPYDAPQSLVIIRDTFADDNRAGVACFDRSDVFSEVDIDIQVAPVEVREVVVGGGGGITAQMLRDAMTLTTAASIANGSIDDKLNKINTNTNLIPAIL